MKITEGLIIAFIDIGTNSIRLLLVQHHPNSSYRIITQQKETVRLGEGEFSANEFLQPEAINRAVLVCRKFTELARSYAADEIIAVATSATRDAENQEEFLQRLKEEAGLEVNVISGREEARLIYLGISSGVNLNRKNAFFIDIGGGSTEVIIGNQTQYHYLDSLKLGAIRLTSLFLAGEKGPISQSHYGLIQRHVRNSAIRTIQKICEFPIELAYGSSGTVENLAEIAARMFNKKHQQRNDYLEYEHLKQIIQYLCSLSLEERRKVPGINPERADIIIGGAAILDTIMQELELPKLHVSDRGLRDGLLVDYLYRTEHHSPETSFRERSVLQLGRACGFDEYHANKVAKLALELFDSASEMGLHSLKTWERELLEYAALLHDIGSFLSYNNHQNHTYYLICNADLLGFNQAEITIIAATAFFHRKTLPRKKHPEFASLEKEAQKVVIILSTLLRIAESLDRSHTGMVNSANFIYDSPNTLILEINTNRDCQLEIWGLQNHQKVVEEAFGKELEIKINCENSDLKI